MISESSNRFKLPTSGRSTTEPRGSYFSDCAVISIFVPEIVNFYRIKFLLIRIF